MIKGILDENEDGIKEYEIRKDYNGLIQSIKYFKIGKKSAAACDLNLISSFKHHIRTPEAGQADKCN